MKRGGRKAPSLFRGILFAQAAKPSAKRVRLTPYLFLPVHHVRRSEPLSSFLAPCNDAVTSLSITGQPCFPIS